MYLEKVFSERLNLKNVSTSRNYKYGLVIEQGVTNAMIDSWYSIGNQNDGLNLKRQEGKLLVNHCVVHSNRQNGLLLTDGQFRRLQSLQLNNCQVSENSEYGVLFEINSAFSSYQDNYTITLSNSTISNNALGGFKLIPMFCYWKAYSLHRRVKLLFVGNVVTANQKFGLLVDGPEWYEAKAVLANNTFKENIGFAIKIGYKNFSNSLCKVFNSFPVRVQIVANIFTKNIGEYTCFIDYNALPAKRQVIINKNWFLENQGIKSFSNSYIRTKTQAVIAATEGNITVEHNSFDNPSFPHDFAFFFKDHSRVILARKNWWGTRDECKIKDRIFDFEDRVELPRIQYYPFLLFRNSSSAQVHSGVRPSCFVRGNKISGILDEAVNITRYFSPYQVIGDVIIQPEGVLTIEHGVTLEFPLKGLFLVHGQIIMRGSSKERVNFIPKTPSAQKLRLVEGPGPWEGKVEIWFNNTWLPVCMRTFRYEYKVVCRQLGYEWVKSYHNDSNGKDDMFLHNVRCDTDQTDNITDCNMKNWTSSLSCTTNVLHVSCKIPFWAGIHFAVTSKKSFFLNVDIQYAGFAYREDLGIPGIAFRVDLSRHIISRVSVSNSAGMGFQIMYPDPFDKSHGIVNSTISKTELDGIRLEAPFFSLLRVDVINTKGYGFLYHYNWNSLNAHVLTIADETAKKFIQTCTENETFIDDSSLVYYLAVTARSSVACQRTITVSQKYTIGVQLIHHDVNSSAPFYIYSGRNKSSSEVWDVQSIRWSNRPIWMTRNSSILLENSYGRNDYVSTIHLLLFLIKEGEAATSKSENLIINDSTFSHNAPGGIYLGGEDSGNIQIVNSAVRYSPRNGLETAFLRLDSLTVFNCEFMTHQIGIKLGSLQKWRAPQKLGSPGNVNIENSKVSNSTQEAIHVEDSNKLKSIHIKNSSVTHNDGFGLYLGGFYTSVKLLVTETRFAWNLGTSVYSRGRVCLYPCISRSVFKNSSFLNNLGPVVNIDGSPWEIESNVFANNTKAPVIVTPFSSRSDYRREVFVRKNHFLLNVCEEKGVIYITGNSKKMIIEGNVFRENYGRSIFIAEMFPANATIRSNVFKDNRCPNSGVIEVRRMEMDIEIVGNVFQFNQGLFMVRLHCEYAIRSRLFSVQKKLNFSKNSLSNNTEVSSRTQPCEVRISGLTNSKAISINYNIFNSNSFSKELCVNTHASSHRSILPVPLNFWGYEDEVKIKQRIFDAEDNYEHTLAGFHPFLNNAGNVVQNSSTRNTFDVPAEKYLGGRILFSVQLRKNQSPFIVLSDVTILPNASLTVEAGVEVRFKPGVGMLILGSLFVHGAKDEPVTFSLWKRNQSEKSLPVRLVGGKFPWQGRAEIFHQGNWTPVCLNKTASFETNSAKVVCEHLGYQTPLNTSFSPEKCTSVWTSCAFLSCNGSEADVKECSFSFHNLTCNSSTHVLLNCSGGKPWGNIRFVREVNSSSHHSTSYLQHVNIEHCGEIHGHEVAAIESIQYVPDLSFLTVLNCTAGSIKVWFPEKQVSITNSSFMNCGGNGFEIMNAKQNVAIESVRSVKNSYGLRFTIPNGGWMHGLPYGQADVCGSEKLVPVKDREVFLYFRKPFLTYSNPRVSCSVSVYSQEFYGLAVQMLVMRNMQYLSIYNHRSEVLKFSPKDLGPLSRRVIPWNYIRVDFEGWFQSEMILRVHSVEKKDIPCTFERGLCGWRNYPRPIYKGVAVTQKWHLDSRRGLFSSVNDHTYLWKSGTYIRLGLSYFQTGYGAITSPPISNDSNYCYFVFYYKLWMKGTAYLSILLEGLNGNESTILWSTNDTMDYWKKEVIMLPQTSSNYSIVFLGFFRYTAFIAIDDMDFIQCGLSPGVMHSVSESVFSGNYEQGISYMSNQTKSHILKIERCQITNNGLSPVLNGKPPGAIHLNAVDQVFKIVNNYLAENKNGGIFSSVRHEDPPSQPPQISQIHANTLESNKGGTLILEGNSEPYLNVNVTNNYFSLNLAQDWNGIGNSVCNITRLLAIVRGNFFYKNIGHYVFFYDLPKTNMTGLQFVNNTLYKNSASGLNVNYGATILCNGGAEIHGNVLHNPGNRYQISTTMQGSSLIANATFNWWGENVPDLIAFLILDKKKEYRLSLTVIFQPFIELLPRRVISESCPPEWIKEDEMCFLYKGGSLTFHEAEKYCWSYGGNLITMLSGEDKRLVNSLRQQESLVRPSVLPSLWIMGRRFVREPRSSYGQDNGICAVVDNYGNITESHCNRLNPFVCVRRPVVHCPNGCFHNGDCIGAT
ncbi:protein bark beetle-like isoform X1 [Stylophora pistillata]|uniref:protein bark beetle-like isoform X1 n=1 Tax=Stylophora pistillata TaxID=50429 RepID=UPI000C03958B|nr:protein bark beetle-like isoform X1 [Stylophora pistillata]